MARTTKTILLALLAWGCAPDGPVATDGGAGGAGAAVPGGDYGAQGGAALDEPDVRTFLASYYEAFSDRDWDRFARHFWPGATMTTVWTPPGETLQRVVGTTIPEFVRQAPDGPGSREVFEERMLTSEIDVRGDLAHAWVRYAARFGDPPEIVEWEGLDAFSLLRHEGEWRIVSLAYLPETE